MSPEEERATAVERLVDSGNDDGPAEFYAACGLGQTAVVDALLRRGCDPNAAMKNVPGRTSAPIHIAAARGRTDVVRTLVAHANCDVNALTGDGRNAAHFAAGAGHVSALVLLVRAGCDSMRPDDDGETPGYVAALHRHEDVLGALESLGGEATAVGD